MTAIEANASARRHRNVLRRRPPPLGFGLAPFRLVEVGPEAARCAVSASRVARSGIRLALRGFEAIAHTVNRFDVVWRIGNWLNLGAQILNVQINGAFVAFKTDTL